MGLSDVFHAAIADPPLKQIARAIIRGYAESWDGTESFEPPERRDVLGHFRRANIEKNLKYGLSRFAPAVSAKSHDNATRNCSHVRVESGRVVLTVHAVTSIEEMVGDALYRQEYARAWQSDLFIEATEPPAGARLYALALHVPDMRNRGRPAAIAIRFPDEQCKEYIGYPIDLLKRFPDLMDGDGGQEATIDKPKTPTLNPGSNVSSDE